jgi:RNA polymerase I-specific transcription initiation factor RRN3
MFLLCGLESQLFTDDKISIESPSSQLIYQHAILHRTFAAQLLEIIVDPYRATLTRQSGACYLASFISRASYVGPETVCESISALLRWAEAYIDSVVSIRAADAREQSDLHSLFYTVCQAAFYIMSFRGPEAIQFYRDALAGHASGMEISDEDEEFFLPDPENFDLGTKRWTRICNHELQPLRFCLESVRSEFLHVAHAYDLIEEQVLDKLVVDAKRQSTGRVNKRAASAISTVATLEKQRQTGGVGGLGRGSNPLKSFFPFDPLLLRRSHDFIEQYYKHWQGPCEEEDILVIDDVSEGGDDQIFEMDENLEASDDEADGDEDEDGLPVIVSDQENREDDDLDIDENMRTPDVHEKKELQRKNWTETMKRPRSLSIENGSW